MFMLKHEITRHQHGVVLRIHYDNYPNIEKPRPKLDAGPSKNYDSLFSQILKYEKEDTEVEQNVVKLEEENETIQDLPTTPIPTTQTPQTTQILQTTQAINLALENQMTTMIEPEFNQTTSTIEGNAEFKFEDLIKSMLNVIIILLLSSAYFLGFLLNRIAKEEFVWFQKKSKQKFWRF